MSLLERLNNDVKEAMKARDKMRTQTLRMVLSEVKYAQVAAGPDKTIDEASVQKVVASYHKKLAKSLDDFPDGEKREAIQAELGVVEEYLPKKASPAQIEGAIDEVMAAVPEREFGVLMKQVLVKLGSAADGKAVSEALRKRLG